MMKLPSYSEVSDFFCPRFFGLSGPLHLINVEMEGLVLIYHLPKTESRSLPGERRNAE